jgi:hypothetical protein
VAPARYVSKGSKNPKIFLLKNLSKRDQKSLPRQEKRSDIATIPQLADLSIADNANSIPKLSPISRNIADSEALSTYHKRDDQNLTQSF